MAIQENRSGDKKAVVLMGEISKLCKKLGVENAIKHLESVNSDKKRIFDGISVYEFIAKTVIEVFEISERDLFQSREHFTASEPRMTMYYLISKYMKCSHKMIAANFQKNRINISVALHDFNKRIPNKHIPQYKDYFLKHDKSEKMVIEFLDDYTSQKKSKEPTKLNKKVKTDL